MANELKAGQVLNAGDNKYTIRSVLGSGGFGITYSATLNMMVGNLPVKVVVAIKEHFLKSDCSRDISQAVTFSQPVSERVKSSMQTFVSEARRLQSISGGHPNIVHVNEVFMANNTAYYVMEYLKGRSLAQYVRERGPLSWNETIDLMSPIISAVAYLHDKRITHLDIKPANIMLSEEDGKMRPVLIDFGLSKHYNDDGSATSTLGTQGFSDGYAPVEQYVGIKTFSPESDVYSLGATILYCLTGKTPPKALELDEDTLNGLIPESVPAQGRSLLVNALAMKTKDRTADAGTLARQLDNVDKEATQIISKPVQEPEQKKTVAKKTVGTKPAGSTQNVSPSHSGAGSAIHTKTKRKSSGAKLILMCFGILVVLFVIAGGVYVINKNASSYSSYSSDSEKKEEDVPEVYRHDANEYNGMSAAELIQLSQNNAKSITDYKLTADEITQNLALVVNTFFDDLHYLVEVGDNSGVQTAAAGLLKVIAENDTYASEYTQQTFREAYDEIAETARGRDVITAVYNEAGYDPSF